MENRVNITRHHFERAIHYARLAEDPNLLVSALNSMATHAFIFHDYGEALDRYLESLDNLHGATPLLQARTYLGLAATYAYCNNVEKAFYYLNLGCETLPDIPENDPYFLQADCDCATLHLFEGLVYMGLDMPERAQETFARLDCAQGHVSVRTRIEILIRRAFNAITLEHVDLACISLREAALRALALPSNLYYTMAQAAYRELRCTWPFELKVRLLSEFFM